VSVLDEESPAQAPAGRTDDVVLAEKAVIASMIASRHAAEEALDLLGGEECLADGAHRAVYAAVRWLTEEGGLEKGGSLRAAEEADGSAQRRFAAVLGRLVEVERGVWRTGQAGVILAGLYRHATPGWRADAAIVARAAGQRRTLTALQSAWQTAAAPGFDAGEHGEMIRDLIDGAIGGATETSGAVNAADLYLEALERMEKAEPPGAVQFPWAELRDLVPYARPGQLISVLARPGIGKSLIAGDLARHVGLKMRLPMVLFTLEMDRNEVIDRLIAAESGVQLGYITSGEALTDAAWERIGKAQERFGGSELIIDDTPRIGLSHIRARLRGMAARGKPAHLAIVDYLQLMDMTQPGGGRAENRQQEVAATVGGLKAIARQFRIPVVMLCQLNRGPEQRTDKRPFLSDARESGSIDNDSDVAILAHRPDFYEPESPRAGEADLIVDKNRNGRRGTATVGFQGHYARLVDLARTPTPAAQSAGMNDEHRFR
jgi:replicative DNA helicase